MSQNLKNIKLYIGVVAIIIIVISIFLIVKYRQEKYNKMLEESATEGIGPINSEPVEVESESTYYTVEWCIDKYTNYAYEKDSKNLYNILSKEYIQEEGITEQNIFNKINGYDSSKIVRIKKMLQIMENENYGRFFVFGTIRNADESGQDEDTDISENMDDVENIVQNSDEKINVYEEIEEIRQPETDFFIEVKLDFINSTYEIIPDHRRYNDEVNEGMASGIELNSSNKYEPSVINNETMSIYLMEDYKENIKFYIDEAYNSLKEEYRNKRFGSIENFKKYVEGNKDRISDINVKEYAVDNVQNSKKYIIKDQEDNYYVFEETAVMNYSLMLDIYTIPLQENIETYESATDKQKVAMNINKWVTALNNQDYKYMYEVINSQFKQKYFPTLQDFTNFLSTNFFIYNSLSLGNYYLEGDTHIYEISIQNRYNEEQSVELSIIMRLNEGLEYEMSFGV
ncbi:MAG: hypothetical protein Q4G05_01795 [Clostridia bacterium]|nr:hypothetical protein [Clostridia bacterium]